MGRRTSTAKGRSMRKVRRESRSEKPSYLNRWAKVKEKTQADISASMR
jgi:hypothetical protein